VNELSEEAEVQQKQVSKQNNKANEAMKQFTLKMTEVTR
jgi:hypothetical protein